MRSISFADSLQTSKDRNGQEWTVNWNVLQYICAIVELQPVATRLPGVRLPLVISMIIIIIIADTPSKDRNGRLPLVIFIIIIIIIADTPRKVQQGQK